MGRIKNTNQLRSSVNKIFICISGQWHRWVLRMYKHTSIQKFWSLQINGIVWWYRDVYEWPYEITDHSTPLTKIWLFMDSLKVWCKTVKIMTYGKALHIFLHDNQITCFVQVNSYMHVVSDAKTSDWTTKVSTLSICSLHRRQSRWAQHWQPFAVDKALFTCRNQLSGHQMCLSSSGSKLMSILFHASETYCHQFSLIEQVSKQWLLATYYNDIFVHIK